MYFLYDNNLADYTVTSSDYSDVYPFANVLDLRLSKIWKGTDDDVDQRIVIDCGSAVAPDAIAICGHNFDVQTIKIQANTSDSWGSPAFSYTFTSIEDLLYYFYSGTAYQYWSILIEDNDASHIPEIGYIFFGDYFRLDVGISPSKVRRDKSIFDQSDQGALFSYDGEIFREYKISIPLLAESEIEDFEEMLDVVKKKPFITIFDSTNARTQFKPLYGFIPNDIEDIKPDSSSSLTLFSLSFSLKEAR
jgi:hypothetical protein